MIKTLANKFRSYCGSVLNVNSQSLGDTSLAPARNNVLPTAPT